MQEGLIKILKEKNLTEKLIETIIESGYFLQHFQSWDYKSTINSVGDMMYGTKQSSSNFDIDQFISYAKGEYKFEQSPQFNSYRVKNKAEILDILNDERRKKYIVEGKMSFRGQTKEYFLNRKLPNPYRSDKNGKEISILPGAYRNKDFKVTFFNDRPSIIQQYVRELEPNFNHFDFTNHDLFRAEQHYASQTEGLDITFDIETALFFSNYKLFFDEKNIATHKKIEKGNHQGVIYCFVFRDPPVKKTEFLIREFSLFQTYVPKRILRQNCGLPFFSDYDRNIAVCDIDCIIYLDNDFECEEILEPNYMFPDKNEDSFYGKLLEIKNKYSHSKQLSDIVEYKY